MTDWIASPMMLTIRSSVASGVISGGDSLCIAPPLMTPEATLDRIVGIVGEAIQAAA